MDLVELTDEGGEVVSLDLFIDVIVPTDGRHQRLLDFDEYGDAVEAGVLPVGGAGQGDQPGSSMAACAE